MRRDGLAVRGLESEPEIVRVGERKERRVAPPTRPGDTQGLPSRNPPESWTNHKRENRAEGAGPMVA